MMTPSRPRITPPPRGRVYSNPGTRPPPKGIRVRLGQVYLRWITGQATNKLR